MGLPGRFEDERGCKWKCKAARVANAGALEKRLQSGFDRQVHVR